MKKKILLLGLVVLGMLLSMSLVSAYTYSPYYYTPRTYERLGCTNCGTMPRPVIGTSPDPYVRIGGAFGASSNYIIGLRPGTYYQTPCVQRPSFYYQPCNTRTNWLGGYGTYGGYYGSWGGYGGGYTYPYYGTQYSNINYIYSGIL